MNSALLKGSKEGSGTAGTAAVNMAADPECCFLRGGKAAALCIFAMVYLNLGTDFQRLTYLTANSFPNLCWLKRASTEALGALPCRFFFMFPIWVTYPTRQQLTLKRDKRNFLPSFWKSVRETEEERNSP